MEKEKDRVLAYTLATPVEHDALEDVSGGSGMYSTFLLTGDYKGTDIATDR